MESVNINQQNEETAFLSVLTNQVLVQEKDDKIFYYIPCYVRLKVKGVKEFEIQKMSGVISATLLFSLYHGNMPNEILQQFIGEASKAIIIQLPRQESFELKESNQITLKQDLQNKMINFVIRKELDCTLEGDVFFTPFEIFNLYLSITVQTLNLDPKANDGRNIHIKFNCMNSDIATTIDSGSNCEYGPYTLAGYFLDSDYSNQANHRFLPVSVLHPEQRINLNPPKKEKGKKFKKPNAKTNIKEPTFKTEEGSNIRVLVSPNAMIDDIDGKRKQKGEIIEKGKKQKKLNHFQYAHFRIPLYKYPMSSLISLCVPIWILAFINLATYYVDCNLIADRTSIMATVTLAFVAFLPTINEKIPQTSIVKLIEIILYVQIGTTFLTQIDTLQVRKQDVLTYQMDWSTNPYFLITMWINIFCFLIIVVLLVLHKVWWERIYTRPRDEKYMGKMMRQYWENKECDKQFKEAILANKVMAVTPAKFAQIKIRSDCSERFE